MSSIDLSVQLGSLKLKNPVMLASGTCGYGNEINEFMDLSKIVYYLKYSYFADLR